MDTIQEAEERRGQQAFLPASDAMGGPSGNLRI